MSRKHEIQRDFYPAWRERLDELRARLRSIEPRATGLSPRRWEQVRELVMAVASYEDADRRCRQGAERLLATASRGTSQLRSKRQLYEARREAEHLGLLASTRDYNGGGRGADLVWVVDEEVDRLAQLTRAARRVDRPPAGTNRNQREPTVTNGNQPEPTGTNLLFSEHSPKGNANSPSSLRHLEQSSFSLPSVPCAPQADTLPESGARRCKATWAEVEEEVFSLGIDDVKTRRRRDGSEHHGCVAWARRSGATIDEVLAIVEYWLARRGAWDSPEGALWKRLKRFDRTVPVHRGWSPTRVGWRDPREAAEAEARIAERKAAEQARAELLAAERRRQAALEAELGPELELLTDIELEDVLAGDATAIARLRKRTRRSPVVRIDLLEALDARRATS